MVFRSQSRRFACVVALVLALVSCPLYASHVRRGPTAPQSHRHATRSKGHASRHSAAASSVRPRAIDDARATEIQGALVKAGYLQSSSGHWDEASADAMRKLQADNGWQTKLIPDSRALIKLGLGANEGTSPGSSSGAAPAAAATGGTTPGTE